MFLNHNQEFSNMHSFILLIVATAVTANNLPAKLCQSFDLNLTVTSENFVFGAEKFNNDFDVADFVTDLTSREPPPSFSALLPAKVNQTGTYTISSTFCTPQNSHAAKKDIVLLATHGLNFDRK